LDAEGDDDTVYEGDDDDGPVQNGGDADYEEGDDELTDDDGTEDEETVAAPHVPVFGAGTTGTGQTFGVGVPVAAVAVGAKDETPRLASRLLAQAEDAESGLTISDPTSYRDRSRSPMDDGNSRD